MSDETQPPSGPPGAADGPVDAHASCTDDVTPGNLVEIDFRRTPGPPPVQILNGDNACKHMRMDVDAKTRKVHCRRCGARLDAFDAILRASEEWQRWNQWLSHARREKQREVARLAEVKAEEKKARARLDRARKRLPLVGGESAELELLREFADAYRRRDLQQVRLLLQQLTRFDATR